MTVTEEITVKDFYTLIKKAQTDLGISDEDIERLPTVKSIKWEGKRWTQRNAEIIYAGIAFLFIIGLPSSLYVTIRKETELGKTLLTSYYNYYGDNQGLDEESCVYRMSEFLQDPFRPPVDCNECKNVTGIKYVNNLTHAEFLDQYAFSMQPVLIKDGQNGWTAKETFSYNYFSSVYSPDSEALEKVTRDCQFFPYQTKFSDLSEFFNMSEKRANGEGDPWYVGWSNCDGKAANELRKHYKLPYFLPPELDHSKTDWVFMGLPGYGANMHIDFVGTLSWQAQVKGLKKWILETPPECFG
uniref:JmjC domain-containing protein n=1 Tax=Ciona savignyi TaxID=51511 RepID=H2YDK2_CIOSA